MANCKTAMPGKPHHQSHLLLKTLLLASYLASGGVLGYSRGAPDTTCESLMPGHGRNKETTASPYTITPGTSTVEAGKKMLVTLQTSDGEQGFKGFLIQARNAENDQEVVGTFFTTDHSYLTCGKGFNNAVTHSSASRKSKVLLEWQSPSDFSGEIVFKGTFVRAYDTYWVGVTSEKVTITRAPGQETPTVAPVTTTTTTTTTTTSTTTTELSASGVASLRDAMQNVYLGCENNKGCFGFPSGCTASEKCDMLMTYSKVSTGYKFEIMGTVGSSGYIAFGLSDDDKMGTDSVMACTSLNGEADVLMAFNNGKSNEILSDSQYGLSDIKTAQVDGRVYCSFIRQALTEIKNINFDLAKDRFHLMLARGPANADQLRYHDKRTVSASTAFLEKFEAPDNTSELFVTLHACFMIGAWVCAASCGILLARYFKQTWLQNKCCGIDQWFHLHRFFMGLTWSLTIAGFALIVYKLQGWTERPISENPHPILGVISTGLCFIQPFMALCRCNPNHKNRPVFNWFHWFVGNSAQILALAAIFYGLDLVGAPTWTWFILIIFIAFHCIVHLILSIGQCVSDSKEDKSNNVFPMKEMNGSRNPLHPVEKRMDAPGGTFRKTMLAIYLLVTWLITAVLILIVVFGEEKLREWKIIFWEE